MSDHFKYFIVTNASDEEGIVDRSHGTTARFSNPVSKGDKIYWDHETGSCGGVVLEIEHHPTVSVIIASVL